MRTDLRRLQSQLSRRHGARLAALSMLFAVGVALGAEPQEWLERMNHALKRAASRICGNARHAARNVSCARSRPRSSSPTSRARYMQMRALN